MVIKAYSNFSKRINSTKQPTGGTDVTVRLKGPCSIENPVFDIENWNDAYNYIKWGSRYYYVTDVTYITNTIQQIRCDLDVLATFKSNILNTTAFVEYSSSVNNAYIYDGRISQTEEVEYNSNQFDFWGGLVGTGTYILTVASETGTSTFYGLDANGLSDLGAWLSTISADTPAMEQIRNRIERIFGRVYDAILNCIWVPFDYSSSPTYNIKVGSEDTGVQAKLLSRIGSVRAPVTYTIPYVNSETARRSREKIEIFLPGYGSVNLTPSDIGYATTFNLSADYDPTGCIIYILNCGGMKKYYSCQVGAEIPITRFTQGIKGMLLGAWGRTMGDAVYSGMASPLVTGLMSALGDVGSFIPNIIGRVSNIDTDISSKGGQGGTALGSAMRDNLYGHQKSVIIKCISNHYAMARDNANFNTNYGRPYFSTRSLTGLTGFCKCNGASVELSGFESEKAKVNAFVNGGFFIE